MNHRILRLTGISFLLAFLFVFFFCTENPHDPDATNYDETTIKILIDTSNSDTLYTDAPIRVGVETNFVKRVEKLVVDFGNGVSFNKKNNAVGELGEIWLDSNQVHSYNTIGTKKIIAYVVTSDDKDVSDTTYVKVFGKIPHVTKHPKLYDKPFEIKKNVSFDITAIGTDPLMYQWYKDSLVTDSSGTSTALVPINGSHNAKYTINSTAFSDSGNYSCIVTNAHGADTSNKTKISVIPEIADSTWPNVYFAKKTNSGNENVNGSILLHLSKPFADNAVFVRCNVSNASSAILGIDYSFSDTIIKFKANETVKTLSLKVNDDAIVENNENIIINIISAEYAVLAEDSVLNHIYTIKDNDKANVGFATKTTGATEADSIDIKDSIPVQLSAQVSVKTTVDYVVVSGTATGSGENKDYELIGQGTLIFLPLITKAYIKLNIIGDTLPEGDEIISFALRNPTGDLSLSTSDSTCTYIISDNDVVSIKFSPGQNTVLKEGTDSLLNMLVSISKESEESVSVEYSIFDTSINTAIGNGEDYTLLGSGKITFQPKQMQQSFNIKITNDAVIEKDEQFIIQLKTPSSNAVLGIPNAITLHIIDDDMPIVGFIGNTIGKKETTDTTVIQVTLSGNPKKDASVGFRVLANSTAELGADYKIIKESPLKFNVGDSSNTKDISIKIINDIIDEDLERIIIELYDPQNLELGTQNTYTLIIEDDEHQVTFSTTGNGTVNPSGTKTLSEGTPINITATPGNNQYFTQWVYSNGIVVSDPKAASTQILNVTSNGTVTAEFSVDICTLTVLTDAHGTAYPTGTNQVNYNQTFKCDSVIPAENYAFSHWEITENIFIDKDDSTNDNAIFTVRGNGTIKPQFVLFDYIITVIADGGGIVTPTGDNPVDHSDSLRIEAKPNIGFQFIEWRLTPADLIIDNSKAAKTVLRNITKNGTVTAVFERITFSVRIDSDGNGTTTPNGTIQLGYDTTIDIVATTTPPYKFFRWEVVSGDSLSIADVQASSTKIKNIRSGGIIKAVFGLEERIVTLISGDNEHGTVGNSNQQTINLSVEHGEDLRIEAHPKQNSHYHFTNWEIVSGSFTIDNLLANIALVDSVIVDGTIKANFTIDQCTLSVNVASGDNGSITTPSSGIIIVDYETENVTIVANPDDDYEFSGWVDPGDILTQGQKSQKSVTIAKVTKSGILTATFKHKDLLISVIANIAAGGTVTPNTSSLVPYNTSLSIEATPAAPDYYFEKWEPSAGLTVDDPTSKTAKITAITVDGTVKAVFKKHRYTITIANPANGTIISPTGGTATVDYGFNLAVEVQPATDYNFINWSDPDGLLLPDSLTQNKTTIVNITKSGDLTANLSHRPWVIDVSSTPSTGGSTSPSGSINYNFSGQNPITITATPIDVNYKITGWIASTGITLSNTGASLTTQITATTQNGSVQAKFEKIQFSIELLAGAHGSVDPDGIQTISSGETLDITATPDPNYPFLKWQNEGSETVIIADPTEAATTISGITHSNGKVRAIFTPDVFAINIRPVDLANVGGEVDIDCFYGQVIEPTATQQTDSSTFANWSVSNSTKIKDTLTGKYVIHGDGIITANYSIKSFAVTVASASDASWGTVSDGASIQWKGTLDLTATEKPNYDFDKWEITSGSGNVTLVDGDKKEAKLINVRGAVTVSASFKAREYTITVAQSPNGGGSQPVTGDRQIDYNGTLSLSAVDNAGYDFSGWTISPAGSMNYASGNNANSNPVSVIVKGAGTITATFTGVTYTVTVEPSNPNYGTVTPTSPKQVSHNGTLPITATVKRGCKFTGWTVSGTMGVEDASSSGTSTNVIDVLSGGTVTANFAPITPVSGIVYVDKNANSAGGKNGTSWFNAYDELAKALEDAAEDSEFWVAEGIYKPIDGITGTGTSVRFELQENEKLYGGFIGNEISLVGRGDSWKSHKTILSGEIGSPGSGDNTRRVILIRAGTLINGCIIESAEQYGITVSGTECEIVNTVVRKTIGTAIAITPSAVSTQIKSCFILDNAGISSAGIFMTGNSLLVSNTVFYNNTTTTSGGPALRCEPGFNPTVFCAYCTFVGNRVSNDGSSSAIKGASELTIINSVFYDNISNGGNGTQLQIETAKKISRCIIMDTDGNALSGVEATNNCYIETTFNSDFINGALPEGSDGDYFTSSDGFNIGSSSFLFNKARREDSVYPFAFPNEDILGNSRSNPNSDVGAYER